MTYYPTCAVCGQTVDPGSNHVVVDVEHKRVDDRNKVDDYVMHVDCQRPIFEGWRTP